MKRTALLLTLSLAALLQAISFNWKVETTRAQPFEANAFSGETFDLAATILERGAPVTDAVEGADLYYQSPEMSENEWYAAPAAWDAATGTVRATWSPALDTGAGRYRFFLAVRSAQGRHYRAHGTLRLKPSPGFTPAVLEPADIRAEVSAEILAELRATDLADLQTAINGKADTSHSHAWSAITNKPSTFAPAAHTHTIAEVADLQTAINGKADTSHSHALEDIPVSINGVPHIITWDTATETFVLQQLN